MSRDKRHSVLFSNVKLTQWRGSCGEYERSYIKKGTSLMRESFVFQTVGTEFNLKAFWFKMFFSLCFVLENLISQRFPLNATGSRSREAVKAVERNCLMGFVVPPSQSDGETPWKYKTAWILAGTQAEVILQFLHLLFNRVWKTSHQTKCAS